MEFVKQYWWVFAGLLVLLFLLKSQNSGGASGPTLTQLGGTSSGDLALAQLNVSAAAQEQQTKAGLISTLLNWDFANKQLAANQSLGEKQIAASQAVGIAQAQNQSTIAQLNANSQQSAAQLAYQAQLAQIKAQKSAQSQAQWLGLLNTGINDILPLFLPDGWGNGGNGGIFDFGGGDGFGGGWGFGF
jgi:hypothetical protein